MVRSSFNCCVCSDGLTSSSLTSSYQQYAEACYLYATIPSPFLLVCTEFSPYPPPCPWTTTLQPPKMKAEQHSSEMLVYTSESTSCHSPDHHNQNTQCYLDFQYYTEYALHSLMVHSYKQWKGTRGLCSLGYRAFEYISFDIVNAKHMTVVTQNVLHMSML